MLVGCIQSMMVFHEVVVQQSSLDQLPGPGDSDRAGCDLRGAAVSVQLDLQLSDQIVLGVELQLQLVDEGVSLPQLLDLQLQGQLQVPQGAGVLDTAMNPSTDR
ncbi:hypothetical protein INR49_020605 [Caranx melampygus]|nr:hypothetical protein INR49_020605 [Caranx melampygus]